MTFEIVHPPDRDPWVRTRSGNGRIVQQAETFQSGEDGALGNIEALLHAVLRDGDESLIAGPVIFTQDTVVAELVCGQVVCVPLRRVSE